MKNLLGKYVLAAAVLAVLSGQALAQFARALS